jgi:protein-tyrosine-phosphatase
MADKINILFVCRYNRFRSRIAEAYFKKINKNKNIHAKSAGLIKGEPLSKFTVEVAKSMGFDINGRVQGLSSKLMVWQNLTVVVADDVPVEVFDKNKRYGKKVIAWGVKDVKYRKKEEIKRLIKIIMRKVDRLNKDLEKGKIK